MQRNPYQFSARTAVAALAVALACCIGACGFARLSNETAIAAPGAAAQHVQTSGGNLPSGGVKSLDVNVKVGHVTVETETRNTVDVQTERKYDGEPNEEGRRLLEQWRVVVERKGDRVVVKEERPEKLNANRFGIKNLRVEVRAHVPEGLFLSTNLGVGDSAIYGKFASVNAHNGVGRIEAKGEAADFEVESGVGDVKASKLACRDTLHAKSGTGTLDLDLTMVPKDGIEVESGVGDVLVSVPPTASASAHIETGVGDASSDFPLTSEPRGIGAVGGKLNGNINGGGPSIHIHTGTGSARLKKSR